MKHKIAIISSDILDYKMAGVGIRYWEMAMSLSIEFDVSLLCPLGSNLMFTYLSVIEIILGFET